MPTDPILAAARMYFDKVAQAYFMCLILRAVASLNIRLQAPALDLGSGDGRFGAMLLEFLGASRGVIGVDVHSGRVRKASARRETRVHYMAFVQSDACDLPFPANHFRSVFSNALFSSMVQNVPGAFGELRRVLEPGGDALITVCTDRFSEHLWVREVLDRAHLRGVAARYAAAMDQRADNRSAYTADRWLGLLGATGLQLRSVVGLAPPLAVRRWSVLAGAPMRLNAGLRLVPGGRSVGTWSHRHILERALRDIPETVDIGEAAYLLIHARKPAARSIRRFGKPSERG